MQLARSRKRGSGKLRFYNVLDKDNDGLDPLELLVFIQGNQEDTWSSCGCVIAVTWMYEILSSGCMARGDC